MEFSEYYIAYFDVLGSKSYFEGKDDAALDFLQKLRRMIDRAIRQTVSINSSPTLNVQAGMNVEYKLFSDNVALYLKASDSPIEIVRLLTFLESITSVQRDVFFEEKLLLRGGVVKGKLYSDETLIIGQALIDAYKLETIGVYPRILIDDSIKRAVSALINNLVPNEYLTKEGMLVWANSLVFGAVGDKKLFLNYLSVPELEKVYPVLKNGEEGVLEHLKYDSPEEYERTQKAIMADAKNQIHEILIKHQGILRECVQRYCGYDDVDKDDANAVALKSNIMQKYKWLVVYHNYMCGLNKFEDCVVYVKYTYDPITLNDYMEILDVHEKSAESVSQSLKKEI